MSYLNRALSGVSSSAVLTLALLTAFSAQADELSVKPGIELFEEFSTNPTRTRERDLAESAFALRYKPNLEIETRGQTGFNRLKLGVNGRQYHDSKFDGRDANDKFADFEFRRAVSSRLSFFGSAGYYLNEDVDAILVENEGTVTDTGDLIALTSDRPDIETLSGQFGLEYALDRKSSLRLSGFYYDFDYDLPGFTTDPFDPFRNRRDYKSTLGSVSYTRILTSKDSGFVQFSYRDTEFDPSALIEGNFGILFVDQFGRPTSLTPLGTNTLPITAEQTDEQYSVTVGWTRVWSPGLTTSLSGGTTRLRSEQGPSHSRIRALDFQGPDDDGRYPFQASAGAEGKSTSFTGSASLSKTFKRGQLRLFADRQTRPSSGVSASVDETSYGFSYSHRISSKITATVGGRIETREAANGAFDDSARLRRYDASLRWRIRERWSTFVNTTSLKSDADDLFFNSYTDHRATFGFSYAFGLDELSPN